VFGKGIDKEIGDEATECGSGPWRGGKGSAGK
jgi:hypothetical protein